MDELKSYWGGNGTHQELSTRLRALVPDVGPCSAKTPALEKYRKYVNAYYDLYNNGACNQPQVVARYFGVRAHLHGTRVGYSVRWNWALCFTKTEPVMDAVILAAAREQGWV